jgi:hypothetical protein
MKFQEALLLAINGWNENPIADEWLFADFREKFVATMSSVEAFGSIDETVDLLLQQSDESTAIEVLQTIIALARKSETTEIPKNLLSKKAEIIDKFSTFDEYAKNKLQEMFKYYRVNP